MFTLSDLVEIYLVDALLDANYTVAEIVNTGMPLEEFLLSERVTRKDLRAVGITPEELDEARIP